MPKARLTEEMVRLVKPPGKGRLVYYDEAMPGLLFTVNAGGSKTWAAQIYSKVTAKSGKLAGQVITMPSSKKLGRWPHLKLAEARERARVFLANPQAGDGGTFAEVMESFLERHVKGLRTARHVEWSLRHYIPADWQHKTFTSIKRSDVTALMDGMTSVRQADLVLSYLRSMMTYYAKRNDDYVSPLIKGMGRYNVRDHRRERILSDDEIRALWKITGDLGFYGALCQVLLLTGQRRAKVAAMRRADVVDGVWVIPTAKREKTNPGTLPLPAMARRILDAQPHIRGDDRVFPISGFGRRKENLDRRLKALLGSMPDWRLHDLRRTARSLMARAGVSPHHAERVLGHALPGVVGTYDVFAYAAEKQRALARLSALVTRIVQERPRKGSSKGAGRVSRQARPG
jgi:integrase